MKRILPLALASMPTWGCAEAGPNAAWAQEAFVDTVEARRIDLPRPPFQLFRAGPSPDGLRFAGVEGENGDLIVASLDGEVRKIAPTVRTVPWDAPGFAQDARFSRDGSLIAYSWYDEAEPRNDGQGTDVHVRVVPAAGGEPTVVYDTPDIDYAEPMDWSPDNRWVAVSALMADATWQILIVPAEGGEPRLVRALDWRNTNSVGFSPDGRYLAYDVPTGDEVHERDLVIHDLESGRERALRHPANDLLLGWSPNGSLLFQSDRSGAPGAWRVEMRDGRPVGEAVLVKPGFWRAFGMGFTASGDFYYAVETGGQVVYSVSLDPRTGVADGAPRPLTAPGESGGTPAVSRDARLISLLRSGGGGNQGRRSVVLTLRGLEGGEGRDIELPPRFTRFGGQRWLPDGSAVLFSGPEDGRGGLFRLDTRSGDIERLLDDAPASFDVTPDGRQLVYRRTVASDVPAAHPVADEIVVRDFASGEERILATFEWGGIGVRQDIAVSPDGRSLAYFRPRTGTGETASVVELFVMPLAGGEARVISEPVGGGILWTPDGGALLMNRPGTGLVRVPLDGGAPVEIGIQGGALGIDPSGNRLVFAQREGGNPGWAYELWQLRLGRQP